MNRYRNWRKFFKLSIRYKLFATYVLVILIPFLLLLFLHINFTQNENKEAAVYSSHKMLDETKSYLEYKSQAIMEVLNFIALNDLVKTGVSADSKQYEDINVWHMDAVELSRLVNLFRYNDDIGMIQLYMKHGLAGATENVDFLSIGKLAAKPWYGSFSSSKAAFAWLPASEVGDEAVDGEITVLRKVPNEHNIQQFDGIVSGRIKPSAMKSVLNHAVLTPNTVAILMNEQGAVLSHSDSLPSAHQDLVGDINRLYEGSAAGDKYDSDHYTIDGRRHLLGVLAIPHTELRFALIVPYTDILQSSTKARNQIVSIFLLVVPLMLPLSFFVAASATRRIRGLIVHVRKVKHGNFNLAPLKAGEDEIGELTHNFNVMVQNMSGLIDETYSLGREVKNKELKALQAQINPHFLYNTLDLINVMAIESGSRDIKRVVDELAVFYKLSLSNGREFVTLESELQHIEAYVRIQNMRFSDGIRLEVEVPRELYDCELPKIILQPLVENAILHGIMETESEEGTIRISAWLDRGDICVEVADNGVGMTADRLASVISGQLPQAQSGGYGVHNIEERLRLSYGPMYGLKFASSEGEGTSVVLRLPERGIA